MLVYIAVTRGKDDALNAKAEKTVKNREIIEQSVTSTKTLLLEKKDELRNSTKEVTDLHRLGYDTESDPAREKQFDRNLDVIRGGAIAKALADQKLPKNDSVSECLKNYKTKLGRRPLEHAKTSTGSNLCFENKCSDYILRKDTSQLKQAPDRWKSSKKIDDDVEHQRRNSTVVERSQSCEKKYFGSSSETSIAINTERADLKGYEVITKSFRYPEKSHEGKIIIFCYTSLCVYCALINVIMDVSSEN